jgi:hypothetical protein
MSLYLDYVFFAVLMRSTENGTLCNGLYRHISFFSTVLRIQIRIDFGRLDPDPRRECGFGSGTNGGKRTEKAIKWFDVL